MSTSHSTSEDVPVEETQTGLDVNVAAALAYVLGFLSGIVMYLLETENETVRFHAAQSIVVFGGIFVLSLVVSVLRAAFAVGNVFGLLIGTVFGLVSLVISLGALVLWIYLIVRTYQGSDPRIPGAAGIADDLV